MVILLVEGRTERVKMKKPAGKDGSSIS